MKKIILIIIANFLFMNGFATTVHAQDLEKSMDEKAARDLYYKTHSAPEIIDMDCEVNGTEIKPSFDGAIGVGGQVKFELGTKVKATKISWTLKNDEYLTGQELTIVDDKAKTRKTIKLGPTVREYTDKQPYTGSMRKNGFITGRHYELEVKDEKWGIQSGQSRATVDVQFGLMTYYGCSSKPTLNDSDINDLSTQLGIGLYSEKNQFLDINAANQYFYIIYPKKDVTSNLSFKYLEGASTYVDSSSGLTVHRTGNSFNWPVFTKWILVKKKHKNSFGFIADYNIYRTKETLNGTYCFTQN